MIAFGIARHMMITLTRLNGDTFTLNALLIEQIASHPDTTITLTNGKTLVVKESETKVAELVTAYLRTVGLYGTTKEAGETDA